MPEDRPKSAFLAFSEAVATAIEGPVVWFRGNMHLFFSKNSKVVIQHL